MISEQLKYIQHAKRLHQSSQSQLLIIKDDSIQSANPKAILQLLVSQFIVALSDSCLMSLTNQPFHCSNKLPLPMVFAILKKQLDSAQLREALKLLTSHVDRKSLEKVHVLIYNLTKIHQQLDQHSKTTFYLEILLKEEPFFPPAVYDLAICYMQHLGRTAQALSLLERHLGSINSNNPLVHSAFLCCCSAINSDVMESLRPLQGRQLSLTNYFNLGLLFRKKGQLERAYHIFSDLVSKLEFFSSSQAKEKDQKLLLLAKFNLIKINIEQGKGQQAALAAEAILEAESNRLDSQTTIDLQEIANHKGPTAYFTQLKSKPHQKSSHNRKAVGTAGGIVKEGSVFTSFQAGVKDKNNKKLRHLLYQEKNIDKFFKNVFIRFSTESKKLQIGLKDSLKRPREELLMPSQGLTIEEYNQLQEQFQTKRSFHGPELDSCDIQQAIRNILLNLQHLRSGGTITKPSTRGIARRGNPSPSGSKSSTSTQPVINSKFTRLLAARPNNLPSDRGHKNGQVRPLRPNLQVQAGQQSWVGRLEAINLEPFPAKDRERQQQQPEKYPEQGTVPKEQKSDEGSKRSIISEKSYGDKCDEVVPKPVDEIVPKPVDEVVPKLVEYKSCDSETYHQMDSSEPNGRNNPSPSTELLPDGKSSFHPLASSFNLTAFSNPSFRKMGAKKVPPSSSAMNWTSDRRNPLPKVLSAEFQQQMLKVGELERKGNEEGVYAKLLQMYKNFKGEEEKIEILLKMGSCFERQSKFSEAERTFLKGTRFNSAEAFLCLGSLQLKISKIEQGVENLEKANCIRRFDMTIENKLVYGYSLREETMDKALKLAHSILKKEPNSLETLLITAGILEKQGLVEEAIQIVRAIDQVRQTEHIKHYMGILYLAASNLKEAFNCFKEALVLKPDYVPSLIETASIVSEHFPKQAISILNKIMQLSPGNRKALARLGKIYEVESDFESAMATYKAALETQEDYESYMKIGDCLAKKESFIEALLNYKEALNLKKTPQAYAKLALMFELKSDFGKAIQNYQSALGLTEGKQEGTRRNYLLAIGRLHLRTGQFETAIGSLEEVEGEESVEFFKLLGEAYFGNRQYADALGFFEKANGLSGGGDLDVLESMAMCLDRMEEYMASKAIYEKVLQKNPQNTRCLNNLGNILLITGETNEAFYLFETLLERVPKNLEKRLKLADIYAEVGDWSKVEYHLLLCNRQKENDPRILEKLVVLFKEKRDSKMAAKYEKKLSLLRATHKSKLI